MRKQDIELFAVLSGDVNPAHVDAEYARSDMFHRVIAHGMWGGALISAVLGTELPGPGTIYLDQSLQVPSSGGHRRHGHSDRQRAGAACQPIVVWCSIADAATRRVILVIDGRAEVIAPERKVRRPRALLPEVHLHERGARYRPADRSDPCAAGAAHRRGASVRCAVLRGALEARSSS